MALHQKHGSSSKTCLSNRTMVLQKNHGLLTAPWLFNRIVAFKRPSEKTMRFKEDQSLSTGPWPSNKTMDLQQDHGPSTRPWLFIRTLTPTMALRQNSRFASPIPFFSPIRPMEIWTYAVLSETSSSTQCRSQISSYESCRQRDTHGWLRR